MLRWVVRSILQKGAAFHSTKYNTALTRSNYETDLVDPFVCVCVCVCVCVPARVCVCVFCFVLVVVRWGGGVKKTFGGGSVCCEHIQ